MNRTEKQEFVTNFKSVLSNSNFVLVTHYKGLTVSEISSLREKFKENNANFKVTKNSLAKRAVENTDYNNLQQFFPVQLRLLILMILCQQLKSFMIFLKKMII